MPKPENRIDAARMQSEAARRIRKSIQRKSAKILGSSEINCPKSLKEPKPIRGDIRAGDGCERSLSKTTFGVDFLRLF